MACYCAFFYFMAYYSANYMLVSTLTMNYEPRIRTTTPSERVLFQTLADRHVSKRMYFIHPLILSYLQLITY